MTTTPSDPAAESLRRARTALLARPGLVGAPLREALTDAYDTWLAGLVPDVGIALVAVGGVGRREPAPYSDLDLVLLHDGRVEGLAAIADAIWYPIWDSGVGLDHSVRTPDQALSVADSDLKAMLGLQTGNAGWNRVRPPMLPLNAAEFATLQQNFAALP